MNAARVARQTRQRVRVINAPQNTVNYDVSQPQGVLDNVNAFAIDAHAGEAAQVIQNYRGMGDCAHNLPAEERQNLLYFLRSL